MLARVLTLRFDSRIGAFDDGPLREFLSGRDATAIQEYFFEWKGVPHLAVLVTYALDPPVESKSNREDAKDGSGWRSQIAEADIPLLNAIRDWRAERASREGIPPYMVCTNKQLAAMIKVRPQSLTRLATIDGVGKKKLEKYGQELLALLAKDGSAISDPSNDSPLDQDPEHGQLTI